MIRFILKSKVHRARVTRTDRHYEGSLSLDKTLMKAADLLEHEQIHVWDVTNGSRFETYVIPAPANSGLIQINGAAVHLVKKNDLVIITSFAALDEKKLKSHKPKIVFVDSKNKIVKISNRSGRKNLPVR